MLLMGSLHFAVPRPFDRLIPSALGEPRAWTYGSGLAELTSGALLARRTTARLGGYVTAATMAAVFPGNIKMALDAGAPASPASWMAWLRLPFQAPLIAWALRQTKG
jgi:uncharacterized membrane protein